MDDEAYVQGLLAILTNPEPSGIDPADPYGQADDRIDRYDGFGRELRVTSAAVVPSEHGAMVELGFVLDLPDDLVAAGVPREGTLRLPVAAEWRSASNYDDPADYAPEVARQLMRSIHRHVGAHRPRTPTAPTLPGRGEQWQLLLELLGRHGEVTEVSHGRLQVVRDGNVRTQLITPDQWEQELLASGVNLYEGHVLDLFWDTQIHLSDPPPPDEAYLVHWDGKVQRSVREALPPVRPYRRIDPIPGARWVAARPRAPTGE